MDTVQAPAPPLRDAVIQDAAVRRTSDGGVLVKTSFLLTALTVAVKLLGFGRDQFIAYFFGSGPVADAYYLTLTFVIGLVSVIGGTLSIALVPVLTGLWDRRRLVGWRTTRAVASAYLWIVAGVATAVVAGAPWLIGHLLGPGLPAVTRPLAVLFIRVFGTGFVFWAAAPVLAGILNSRRQFVVAACGPIALNGATLVFLLLAGHRLGVAALAAATAIGMVAQVFLLAPFAAAAWRRDARGNPAGNEDDHSTAGGIGDGPARVWGLVKPVFMISLLSQIPSIIDKAVASGLPVGSVSVLAFAQKLMQLPFGLFVGGVATVFYTSLSDAWARKDREKVADELGLALGVTLLVAFPAAVGFATLGHPIVQFVFQHGRFDAVAARLTSQALLFYCIGLPVVSANLVLMRNAFAGEDAGSPLRGYIAALAVNGVGDVLLSRLMGPAGIALASSLGAVTLCAFLVGKWPASLRAAVSRAIAGSFSRVLAATAAMGFMVVGVSAGLVHSPFWMRLLVPAMAGLTLYVACLWVWQPREMRYLMTRVRRARDLRPQADR